MRAVLLALVLLLAGCMGGAAKQEPPRERRAWLDAQGSLLDAAPGQGAVRAGSFYLKWAQGADYPTWRTAPFARDVLVTNLSVDVALRATGPITTSYRFPDLMAYGGSGDAWVAFNRTNLGALLAPGETRRATLDLALPGGGLWVPAGEPLGVKLVPVMTQGDANDIEFLVGPDGSALRWSEADAPFVVHAPTARDTTSGATTGSAYAGDAAPSTTFSRVAIELPTHPAWLVAWMNVTSDQGVPDVDLFLEDAQGNQLAGSGTPTPREMLRLGPESLPADGKAVLVVASYGSAHATYDLAWVTGPASPVV